MSDLIKHTVQPGETLFGIAKENGVSKEAMKAANPQILDINKILPGQIVFIPVEGTGTGGGESPATQPATNPPVASNTVMRGLDASEPLTNAAKCLKNHGFGFAMRYYSLRKRAKNLTLSEAQALVAAGLQLGVVFEETAKRSLDGRAAGINDAKSAHETAANVIGQPAGTPIYFAVDFDAKPAQLPSIKQYFGGVRDGLAEANGGSPRYKVGAYASGLVCSELLKNGLITFSWLTESTGFNGSKEFAKQKLFNLIQIFVPPDGQSVCGVVVDPNEMNPDPIKFPPGLFTI
jgi:hypothetical protein